MKKGSVFAFLVLAAGMIAACGTRENYVVEEPEVYAIEPEGAEKNSEEAVGQGAEDEAGAEESGGDTDGESPAPVPEEGKDGGEGRDEITGYQAAYEEVSRQCEQETPEIMFALIDIDGNGTPELAACLNGYYVSLYTYDDGRVYTAMDKWGYGAMGNAGYEFCPGKNSLRNYNTDYAGAILYTTYMTLGGGHTIDTVAEIVTYNFDDANGNGMPDEEEEGSLGNYSVSYINGAETSGEECASYNVGEYEYIQGVMSGDELRAKLREMQ